MIVAGILTPLEDLLTAGRAWLHGTAGLSWAWAVVALTVPVRVLRVPLAVLPIHSMQRLQAHMREMNAIQERYKNDKRKQNEEAMSFYRENKINPAASCLPLLAQIPIFFSLFFVLRDFDEEIFPDWQRRGETVDDLHWLNVVPNITQGITEHWSGYLLLTIYVVSQVSSSYFMTTQMQKSQRILMLVLPFFFIPFLLGAFGAPIFPIGLLMYWVTTNLWTVGQGLVTRRLMPKPQPLPKRTSRTPPKDDGSSGNGAKREPRPATPAPSSSQPRKVKRKKKAKR